jgi:SAM-dependent methyltransferase
VEAITMNQTISVDPVALRADVRDKYKDVATNPGGDFHFHTGRPLAALLGYDSDVVDALPDRAVESFAGVGNPHSIRPLQPGERVVDLGSGGGFDCFVAAQTVGADGAVIGVDMTPEMLAKSRESASQLGLGHVEFREGILEELPVEDGWADVVIANGVINLVADKSAVFAQAYRALKPGGHIQFADIANGKPLPEQAVCNIDLWTGCVGGGKPVDDWCDLLTDAGFTDVSVGPAIDAFGGSGGEKNARNFDVYAHVFLATKPE